MFIIIARFATWMHMLAEIPVEDYRFDRSTPGIVGQEVYGSGQQAAIESLMLLEDMSTYQTMPSSLSTLNLLVA